MDIFYLFIIASLIGRLKVQACLTNLPNSTLKKYHIYSCDGPSPHFLLSNLRLDETTPYPLPILNELSVYASLLNSGLAIRHVYADFQISAWEPSYADTEKCEWETTDTYGMISNLDACHMTKCPIVAGEVGHFRLTFDIGYIVAFLEDKKLYSLKIVLKNGDFLHRKIPRLQPPPLACFVIQGIFTTE